MKISFTYTKEEVYKLLEEDAFDNIELSGLKTEFSVHQNLDDFIVTFEELEKDNHEK